MKNAVIWVIGFMIVIGGGVYWYTSTQSHDAMMEGAEGVMQNGSASPAAGNAMQGDNMATSSGDAMVQDSGAAMDAATSSTDEQGGAMMH